MELKVQEVHFLPKLISVKTKSPSFFLGAQLSEIVGKARVYGIGKSLREIVASRPNTVSLSTLKIVEAGRHIRPEKLKQVAMLFEMRPLDWIETKIRYVEAYMGERLVPPAPANQQGANLDSKAVRDFAAARNSSLKQFGVGISVHQVRLDQHVRRVMLLAKKAPLELSDKTGAPQHKKDRNSVKYPTVTALRRGESIRPEKLAAICQRLHLPRQALVALKISYAEAYLGEYLLGDNMSTVSRATAVNHPRTLCLLIYSTQNAERVA